MNRVKRFLSAARELSSVEYALMASLVAIVTFASLQIGDGEPSSNLFHTAAFGLHEFRGDWK
jgi:hypothetical protein